MCNASATDRAWWYFYCLSSLRPPAHKNFVAAVTGCKRNLGCSKLHLWKRERQHVLGKQGACVHLCSRVHFLWYLLTEQWWKGRGLKVVLLWVWPYCLSLNAGLLPAWVINSCGSSSKSLPWALLNLGFLKLHGFLVCLLIPCILLGAFTLFPVSLSILLLFEQMKVKFLL